jgi:phosphatidylserine/phosphatidylglycerophosphate/cardiolipin synthase-like enzyme
MNQGHIIISTSEISHEIEKMIQESNKFLIIVSPYLKITNRIKAKFSECFGQIDSCYFIHRKNELRHEERIWMESFSNVHLISLENLHSKIYLNDRKCLITSMNFYEYSQINNFEIGVLIEERKDRESYEQVIKEVLMYSSFSDKKEHLMMTIESKIDYTVGKLFNKIKEVSDRYNSNGYNDEVYIKFCNDAREIIEFNNNELYLDKTAILRSANIGKARFEKILSELK